MGNIKPIDIKNRAYYFFNDMINIKDFDSSLLKIDKKSCKNISIYNIWYITISVNPLYLMIGRVTGHIEENNGNESLIFHSSDENKEVLKKYTEFWNGTENKLRS